MNTGYTSSCRPGDRKTYLAIGQDLFSISEYVDSQYNYSLHNEQIMPRSNYAPAAAMVYTDLDTLRGLYTPTDYGSGIEYADGIFDLFPETSIGLQIGLWLNGTIGCEQVINGDRDYKLKMLAMYLDVTKAGAVFLRIGYEFDNPFFGYSENPGVYVKAYQKIVNYLREELSENALGRTNFVWHSWAAPRQNGISLEDFYPGKSFVDWIGISVFQQLYPWKSGWGNGYVDWGGDRSYIEEVLEFALREDKPTMIAESTPYGGINMNTTDTIAFHETNSWFRWFEKVLDLIEEYDIDMFSYINCNWINQPMWHEAGFGDTRLSSNKHVMKKWHKRIVRSEGKQEFLMGNSLTCAEDKVTIKAQIRTDVSTIDVTSYIILGVVFCAIIILSKAYSPNPEEEKANALRRASRSRSSMPSVRNSYQSIPSMGIPNSPFPSYKNLNSSTHKKSHFIPGPDLLNL